MSRDLKSCMKIFPGCRPFISLLFYWNFSLSSVNWPFQHSLLCSDFTNCFHFFFIAFRKIKHHGFKIRILVMKRYCSSNYSLRWPARVNNISIRGETHPSVLTRNSPVHCTLKSDAEPLFSLVQPVLPGVMRQTSL